MADTNPKLCECGCGKPAAIATQTKKKWGHVAGQPTRFARSHGNVKHRQTKTPTYQSWRLMRDRCSKQLSDKWRLYGGRGIKVCERWQTFANFLEDMGKRPEGMTLDRIDNNGDYEPGNCRWADGSTQSSNRRTNRVLTAFGVSLPITHWERKSGHPRNTIFSRLDRGWDIEAAITTPVRRQPRKPLLY